MPKRIQKPNDKLKCLIISNIEYECSLRGIEQKEQHIIARCSEPTFNKKRKDPGKFTINDLIRFASRLKIPLIDLLQEREVKKEV